MQCEIIESPTSFSESSFLAKILMQVNRVNSSLCSYPLISSAVKRTKLQFNNYPVQICKLL